MASDFRAVPRFFMTTALPATLGEREASVVDLSIRGARLQVTKPFMAGEMLPFGMTTSHGEIALQATVSWCRMAALALDDEETDRYLCGVMFDSEVPVVGQVLDALMEHEQAIRIEDARNSERYSITAQITGSFGVHSAVRILDLSVRGARIAVDRMVLPGSKGSLRFRVDGKQVGLDAEMVWSRPAERRGGFEAGLRIENEEELLRHVIAQLCAKNEAHVDVNSLRRKFDPLRCDQASGLLALV